MGQQYSHLSVEERAVIMIERSKGMSLRSIGRTLGRDVSTISREVKRGMPDQVAVNIKDAVRTTLRWPRRPTGNDANAAVNEAS